ncbi:MAG: hypothetical protein U0U66_13990 [Cytophagaceae bacterium]
MLKQLLIPFLFCLAIIIGPTYNMYVHYDFSHSSDTKSYLAMSNGETNVNPVHRYRLIIPMMAKAIAYPLEKVYTKLWPHRAESLWPLQLSYFIINVLLTSFYGVICFWILQRYTDNLLAVVIGLVAILTSRWVAYIAGLPLTDSLYLITIALLIYSIKSQHTVLFAITILLGGLMKESFLLFAPLIVFAGPLTWYYRLGLVGLSLVILFGFHTLIDAMYPLQATAEVNKETLVEIFIRHVNKTTTTFQELASVRGLGEIFTVMGIFTFVIMYGAINSSIRNYWKANIELYYVVFFACILVHAFISGDAARMFYFGSILYGVMITTAASSLLVKKSNVSSS